MRLIDADNIKTEDVIGGQNEFANDIRTSMKDLINSQPTAYDVDKVVNELEHWKTEFENKMWAEPWNAQYSESVNTYSHAIDIVKAGGINENNKDNQEKL
jgi:hypothetical protein